MTIRNFQKAFSLIELSIVILIIGILIAGITSARIMVQNSRIISAQNLTKSSSVSGTENLVVWFETSFEQSFGGNYPSNSESVAVWYDNNPQSTNKINATQNTSQNQPTFRENIINGIPVLRFVNSSNQFLNMPDGTVPYNNSPYTIFLVSKTNVLGANGMIGSGNYGFTNQTNAFRYDINGINNYWWGNDIISTGNPIKISQFHILTFYYDGSSRRIYVDNSLNIADNPTGNQATNSNNTIGKTVNNEYMDGDIAEIIIFSRGLKEEERIDITNYLSKKFNIKITS
ncbi:MAG: LamG-like jellyroll fold domain-containing protein [Rickettsiales bacterium]|nr:LamG-like jellyroll fold domain-containing protein [Rickettsiales bacterium]